MVSSFLNVAKAYLNRPGIEFLSLILLVPLPMIILADPNKWISLAALAYTVVIGRLYAGSRWLDGYVAGIAVEKQRLREASEIQPTTES